MADPIKYESPLNQLLAQLIGDKQVTSGGNTTSSSTANIDPLMQVFGQQMQSSTPEGMQALLADLFTKGAQQVPQLTQAYANATGSRSSNNSGLSLALGDLNKTLAQQAASLAIEQQSKAGQTAGSIANASRGENRIVNPTTVQRGDPGNAALMSLGGVALNAADKAGMFKKLNPFGDTGTVAPGGLSPAFSTEMLPSFTQGPNTSLDAFLTLNDNFGTGPSAAMSYAPSVTDFISPTDYSYGSGTDFSSAGADAGGDSSWYSDIGDTFSSAGDSIGNFFSSFFADGGQVGSNVQQARGKGMLAARPQAVDAAVEAATVGNDPNAALRAVLAASMQAPQPQQQAMPPANLLNFLRYLLPMGQNNIYNYADGGRVMPRRNFADGGVPRNFNNMGPNLNRGPTQGAVNYAPSKDFSQSAQSGNSLSSGQLMGSPALLAALTRQDSGGPGMETGGFVDSPGSAMNNNSVVNGGMVSLAGMIGGPIAAMALSHALNAPSLQSLALNNVVNSVMGTTQPDEADPSANNNANALDGFLALNDNFGTGPSAGMGSGPDANSAGDASTGDGGTGSASDGSGSDGGTASAANGGKINGKGTGVSDSIPINVSDGEFVISKDVVDMFGADFFQALQDKFHTPAAVQRMAGVS